MTSVEIVDWAPGFQKVSCTKLLQAHAGMDLTAAKSVTDGILDGNIQVIRLSSRVEAEILVSALKSIGASAHVAPKL